MIAVRTVFECDVKIYQCSTRGCQKSVDSALPRHLQPHQNIEFEFDQINIEEIQGDAFD